MNDLILSNLQVHTKDFIQQNVCIVIRDGIIHAMDTKKIMNDYPAAEIIEFPDSYHLAPGFIDMHVHGADGSDVMDATQDALENISVTLAREGTTSFLATTMTAEPAKIEKALKAVKDFIFESNDLGARILGVHLEGPFISPQKSNAQPSEKILPPKIELIEQWQKVSDNLIKLVTLAPEQPNAMELIQYLKNKNIIASIGHTNATYLESIAAIEAGCSHATHLFNAMRGIHQREPGPAVAALLSSHVMAELILDGVHLHPAIVQLAFKLKGTNKIALVTDSMRAKCLSDGVYDLGGQSVTVKGNIASLSDGTLAGSVLKMNASLQNLIEFTGCSVFDTFKMASENPARALGLYPQKGSVTVGSDADLVVLDDQLNVKLTLVEGKVVFLE